MPAHDREDRRSSRIEASLSARRAAIYTKIAAVIDQMPDRFKAAELYEVAGIANTNNPGLRTMIAAVLGQDFKCESILQAGGSRYWRKPNAERIKL